jgi:hypothetical protein
MGTGAGTAKPWMIAGSGPRPKLPDKITGWKWAGGGRKKKAAQGGRFFETR